MNTKFFLAVRRLVIASAISMASMSCIAHVPKETVETYASCGVVVIATNTAFKPMCTTVQAIAEAIKALAPGPEPTNDDIYRYLLKRTNDPPFIIEKGPCK